MDKIAKAKHRRSIGVGKAYVRRRECSQLGNKLFPAWETNVPSVGINSSTKAHFLRSLMLLLLMMTVGVEYLWGQTGTNRSGIYYFVNGGSGKLPSEYPGINDPTITSESNHDDYYYLVPADNPQQANKRDAWFSSDYSAADGDFEKPYLTTYKTKKDAAEVPTGVTNRPHNSVWIVKFASTDNGKDYYYLIHAATGKYVVYEPPYSAKNNRKSVHLLTTNSPGENAMFAITIHSNNYNFRPKSIDTGGSVNKYLNAANANYDFYYSSDETADGVANYFRGLVGLWKDAGGGSDWIPEGTLLDAPTISDVDESNNTFTITDANSLPEGYTIRYTTDGTSPTATTGTEYNGPVKVTDNWTVKAVIVRYGMVLTEVQTKSVEPEQCKIPVFAYSTETGKVSITSETPNAAIYYTLDGETPTTPYNGPFDVADQQTVKAIATNTESSFRDSEKASSKLVLNPDIILAENTYTYDSSAKEPAVNSVKDGEITISSSEYEVGYNNNIDAGNGAIVTITNKAGSNYIVNGSTTFTISPRPLTITAEAKTKAYGAADPEFTYQSTGLVGTDNITGSLARESGEDVGTYNITRGGLTASSNYSVSFTGAVMTITRALLTITADPKTKVYGQSDPDLTYQSSGLIGSDAITGSLTRLGGENAGTYAINQGTVTAGNNYEIHYTTANLTINPKSLTVTAIDKSKTYGDADPELTYTSEGLINSDAITGSLSREAGENAGTYAISQGTITAGDNYSMTYVPAYLTINPKSLTVTAEAKSKTYGDADPVLTYTSEGLINSDAFSGALSRVAGENAGTYAINQGSLTAGNNYEIQYTSANLTINKATLSVVAEAKTKVYSDDDPPEWTYTAEGFKGSDNESIMTGALTRDAGENVGTYQITQGTLAPTANYIVNYSSALLTITPKSLGDGTTPASGITVEMTKTGDNVTPIVKDGIITLAKGTDYDLMGPTDEDGYKVYTITGKANYSGEVQAMYQTLTFWATGETTEGMKNTTPYMTEKANLAQPANMTPCIVSGINMTKHVLHLKRLSYIPKDVPVLLLADELTNPQATDFTTSAKNVEDEEDTSNNQLKMSEGQHVETGQVYAFYKGKFVLTSSGTLSAGKFYLDNPNYLAITEGGSGGGSNAAPLRIVLEDATGIDVTLNEEQIGTHDIWHSVDGRRLNGKPVSKGVYINNGRKVVVK